MRTHRTAVSIFLFLLSSTLVLLPTTGCDNPASDENPVSEGDIPESNLLPLATGNTWVFSAYELDTTSSQKIPSTVHRQVSYIQGTTTFAGKNAFRMIDSTYTPAGGLESLDTTYLAVENGDLLQWTGEQQAWAYLFKKSAGLNNEYVAVQYQEVIDGTPVVVTGKGKIYPKQAVTVPIGTVQAYRAELRFSATVGAAFEFVAMEFYLADGYGPVKMGTPVQVMPWDVRKTEGWESVLVSKSF